MLVLINIYSALRADHSSAVIYSRVNLNNAEGYI
jgi:hypothetical protein